MAILKVGNQFHENFRENDFTKNSNNLEQQQTLEDHPENLVKSKNEKSFTDHPGSCWKKTIEDPENPGLTLENPVGLLIQVILTEYFQICFYFLKKKIAFMNFFS